MDGTQCICSSYCNDQDGDMRLKDKLCVTIVTCDQARTLTTVAMQRRLYGTPSTETTQG